MRPMMAGPDSSTMKYTPTHGPFPFFLHFIGIIGSRCLFRRHGAELGFVIARLSPAPPRPFPVPYFFHR